MSDGLNSVNLQSFVSCAITLISKLDVASLRVEPQGLNINSKTILNNFTVVRRFLHFVSPREQGGL